RGVDTDVPTPALAGADVVVVAAAVGGHSRLGSLEGAAGRAAERRTVDTDVELAAGQDVGAIGMIGLDVLADHAEVADPEVDGQVEQLGLPEERCGLLTSGGG